MQKYKTNMLKDYLDGSILIEVNETLSLRMSKELKSKYDEGRYDTAMESIKRAIADIASIGLTFPANAHPKFYVYIVPNENFRELLNFPSDRNTTGGGTLVPCYDLDGFARAYGVSSNVLENDSEVTLMQYLNGVHELAHMIHSLFFNTDRFICEGFAEALTLYTLDYESSFDEHKELLSKLKPSDIVPACKLIDLGNNTSFASEPLIPHTSVSFELPYISSYLFVRSCLEKIETKFQLDRVGATQKFLEFMRQTRYWNEFLVFEIADFIGVSHEELLTETTLQYATLQKLANPTPRLQIK